MTQRAGKPADDDLHRRFREALDRKRAGGAKRAGEEHLDGRGAPGASNDKQPRQFRRKSG